MVKMSETGDKVTGSYYDKLQIFYDLVYSKKTAGMHYGFWEEDTKTTEESILNTNKFVVKCLDINDDDIILDAGCGVGGTCVHIGKRHNAEIVGITLSKLQVKKARKKTDRQGLSNISYSQQDYTRTTFQDKSFTKIYGIESVCYTQNKLDFFNEAYRLLKNKGKLVISDGYLARKDLNRKERKVLKKCLIGWGLSTAPTKEDVFNDLRKAGFKNIKYHDKFKSIRKTRNRIYRLGIGIYLFTLLLDTFRLAPKCIHENTLMCLNQKRLFSDKNNIATYGVFVAEK
jgi:cyclopropane fatty-acyl-phospholipid synthase-like methyltransferase